MKLLKRFPEYKIKTLELMFDGSERTTGETHDQLLLELGLDSVSRASVINFMKQLAKDGYLNFRNTTGKGGYHRIYEQAIPKEEALRKLKDDLCLEFTESILMRLN